MANPFYLSRKRWAASEGNVKLTIQDGSPVLQTKTIAAGRYFNDSSTAAESLRAQLKTQFDTHPDAGAGFTWTYDIPTGKYTVSHATNFDLTFDGATGTALRDWIGFAGNKSGANTYTSDNVAQGVIFAAGGREDFPGFPREKSGGESVAESGRSAGVGSAETRVLTRWTHGFEPFAAEASPLASGTWDDASAVVPWTWADFHEHHSTFRSETFRFYESTADAIGAYEDDYKLTGESYSEFKPRRVEEASDQFWAVMWMIRKDV